MTQVLVHEFKVWSDFPQIKVKMRLQIDALLIYLLNTTFLTRRGYNHRFAKVFINCSVTGKLCYFLWLNHFLNVRFTVKYLQNYL